MSEETVTITWITSLTTLLGLIITGVFAYLNTRKDKAKTLPVIPPIEVSPQATIDGLRDLLKQATASKEHYKELWAQEQRNFVAAMTWGQKLTRQLRRHAPEVNPADYEPPNGSEPKIKAMK